MKCASVATLGRGRPCSPLPCKNQADRAKTPRHVRLCPIFGAYDRAEQKKSRKSVLRATVQSHASSFRTVCKNSARAESGEKSGAFERSPLVRNRPKADLTRRRSSSGASRD